MISFIEDMPDDVVAFELRGIITHDDYRDVIVPAMEAKLARYPTIRCLCVAGESYEGYELAAMWDETKFGLKNWFAFSKVAVVTDHDWLRGVTAVFGPLIPGEFRGYNLADLEAARQWITAADVDEAA